MSFAATQTAVLLHPDVARIFGASNGDDIVRTIGGIVSSYDFSRMDARNPNDFLHTGVAPCFGNLDKEYLKNLDEEMKIMIAMSNRELAQIPPQDRTFEKVVEKFMNNPYLRTLEPPEGVIVRSGGISKSGENFFKYDRSRNSNVVNEVMSWYTNFIGDDDIMRSTMIDINVMAEIAATTGAAIDSFKTFFYADEHNERSIMDIGVLRYPDLDHPYFKVYRIQLRAWNDTRRVLFYSNSANGMNGAFQCYRFAPRPEIIAIVQGQARQKAIDEADNMFL